MKYSFDSSTRSLYGLPETDERLAELRAKVFTALDAVRPWPQEDVAAAFTVEPLRRDCLSHDDRDYTRVVDLEAVLTTIKSLVYLEDRGLIVAGDSTGLIHRWDLTPTGASYVGNFKAHEGGKGVSALLYTADRKLIAAFDDGGMTEWADFEERGTPVVTYTGHDKPVHAIVELPSGSIASSSAAVVRVWSRDGTCTKAIDKGFGSEVYSLLALPDGRLVTGDVGSGCGTIRIFDPETGTLLTTLKGHSNSVRGLCLLPDGRLVSGSSDYNLRIWNMPAPDDKGDGKSSLAVWKSHKEFVYCVTTMPDGRVASCSLDTKVIIWDVEAGTPVHTISHSSHRHKVVALPDGRLLAAGRETGGTPTIQLWG